jgi:DNA polymerase III sliding clamp (beta) subunit (PCNA family)
MRRKTMDTTVQRLRYVLEVLAPAVGGKKATLPILQNVVVGQGKAYANNLETAVTLEIPEATDDPVVLPHQQLLSLLKHIPGAMRLTINREGAVIKLAAGATTAEFPVPGEVADFPPLPKLEPVGEGQVDGDLFLKTATALAGYAATEASRPVLQCVCVALGDPVEMVGADGFRLAWQTIPVALPAPGPATEGLKHLLVPIAAVHALARVWKLIEKQPTVPDAGINPLKQDGSFPMAMLAVASRTAAIRFTPTLLSFHHGAVTIWVHLSQGSFPDYHQLIPTDLPHKVTFDAEAALRAIRSLADIAAGGSGIVRLNWSENSLVLSAKAEEAGLVSGSVRAHAQGGEGKIAFDIRYLSDYLAGKSGPVLLETSKPSSPGRFFHSGSPDVLVMPMYVGDPAAPATEPVADQPAVGSPADEETHEAPTEGQQAPVNEGTAEEPAAAASPPTKSKKPRRGK